MSKRIFYSEVHHNIFLYLLALYFRELKNKVTNVQKLIGNKTHYDIKCESNKKI